MVRVREMTADERELMRDIRLDALREAPYAFVSMWVRPAARGHGVGEALVEASATWAKARSFDALFLWVTESNAPALALYERCGFTPTGETQPLPEIQLKRKL